MLETFLQQPGIGGIVVLVVLVVSIAFYGGLVVWVARTPRPAGAVGDRFYARQP